MFKWLRNNLREEDKIIFDYLFCPWFIYSIINTIICIIVGFINTDIFGGLLLSWMIASFIVLFYLGFTIK